MLPKYLVLLQEGELPTDRWYFRCDAENFEQATELALEDNADIKDLLTVIAVYEKVNQSYLKRGIACQNTKKLRL